MQHNSLFLSSLHSSHVGISAVQNARNVEVMAAQFGAESA